MSLKDLHIQIRNTVQDEIACALKIDWIVDILSDQIRNSSIPSFQYPTTDPVICAALSFDMPQFKIEIKNKSLVITGFSPTLFIREPEPKGRDYNKIIINYDDIPIAIEIINKIPKLTVIDLNSISAPSLTKGKPNDIVITDNMPLVDYAVKEQAILFQAVYLEILDNFVDSISVPNVLPAMTLFRLQPPYKCYFLAAQTQFLDEYIVITGTPEIHLDENCECRTSSVVRTETRKPNGADINSSTLVYPGPPDVVNMSNPSAIFYIPKTTFNIFSDSILKPAITAGDEGRFLLFKWYWNIAVNVEKLNLTIDVANQEIVIDSAHTIFGNAGVALKVACIYQRIIGADFTGRIDPSRLKMKLALDNGNNVMLFCTYDFKLDVDLNFLIGLDLLLNPILDSILDNMANGKYEFRLKLFNNNFLDLNKIRIKPKFGWRMAKDFDNQSLCIGVEANNG
jgi:hypothetical protein